MTSLANAETTLRIQESDAKSGKVVAASIFPVTLELEQISPEVLSKGEMLLGCRIVFHPEKPETQEKSWHELTCKDGRKFKITSFTFHGGN